MKPQKLSESPQSNALKQISRANSNGLHSPANSQGSSEPIMAKDSTFQYPPSRSDAKGIGRAQASSQTNTPMDDDSEPGLIVEEVQTLQKPRRLSFVEARFVSKEHKFKRAGGPHDYKCKLNERQINNLLSLLTKSEEKNDFDVVDAIIDTLLEQMVVVDGRRYLWRADGETFNEGESWNDLYKRVERVQVSKAVQDLINEHIHGSSAFPDLQFGETKVGKSFGKVPSIEENSEIKIRNGDKNDESAFSSSKIVSKESFYKHKFTRVGGPQHYKCAFNERQINELLMGICKSEEMDRPEVANAIIDTLLEQVVVVDGIQCLWRVDGKTFFDDESWSELYNRLGRLNVSEEIQDFIEDQISGSFHFDEHDFPLISNRNIRTDTRVAILFKNVPIEYTRNDLMSELFEKISSSIYLALHLPGRGDKHFGYCIAYLVDPNAVGHVYDRFHGHRWRKYNNPLVKAAKACEVTFAKENFQHARGLVTLRKLFGDRIFLDLSNDQPLFRDNALSVELVEDAEMENNTLTPNYRCTTILLSNIPRKYTRKDLIDEIFHKYPTPGILALFLPEFESENNGFCFVKLQDHQKVSDFQKIFNRRKWKNHGGHEQQSCRVSYARKEYQSLKYLRDAFGSKIFTGL